MATRCRRLSLCLSLSLSRTLELDAEPSKSLRPTVGDFRVLSGNLWPGQLNAWRVRVQVQVGRVRELGGLVRMRLDEVLSSLGRHVQTSDFKPPASK